MTATRTRSQIGRASRDKGARFQRAVAKAIRPWFPDAISGRENGHRTADFTAADDGDLARTSPSLWWSLKDVAAAQLDKPSLIGGWLAEARTKADGRIPIVVQKRSGHADPLMSWAWLWAIDFVHLIDGGVAREWSLQLHVPIRMRLEDVLGILAAAGYTQKEVA